MPPEIRTYKDGKIIGLRDVRTNEEIGTEEMILTAAYMGKLDDLRRYEANLRAMKATRTGPSRYKSASAAAINQRAAKIARIKARKAQEAKVKESENIIQNLLKRGVHPTDVKNLLLSLDELERNHRTWQYLDAHVATK